MKGLTANEKKLMNKTDHAFSLWNGGIRDRKEIAFVCGLSYRRLNSEFAKAGF